LLLKEEDPNLSNDDIYDRILKDCVDIWQRKTIIDNMPEELKDKERQASGRRGAEEQKKKRILKVTNTSNVASDMEAKSSPVDQTQQDSQTFALDSTNRDETSSFTMDRDTDDTDDTQSRDNLLQFEFSLPVQQVLGHFIPVTPKKGHEEDQVWFSGILDKNTGQVITASIGRRMASHDDTCGDSDNS
jgi:hypothetical protein